MKLLVRAITGLVLALALLGGFLFSMLAPARAEAGSGFKPTAPRPNGITAFVSTRVYGTPFGSQRQRVARLAAPGDVLINEVVTDPQTDWSSSGFSGVPGSGPVTESDEFVELYIKAGGLNLDGWTIALDDGSPSSGDLTSSGAFQVARYVGGGSPHSTAAGAYLVLGNPHGGSSMSNTILIVLKDNHGTVIDQVQLGDGGAPSGQSSGSDDEAVARLPNGADSGDDASDFVQQAATPGRSNDAGSPTPVPTPTGATATASPTSAASPTGTASPTPTVPAPAAGAVVLNEFLPHPGTGQQEFIELFNRSNQAVDLGGWQLDDAPGASKPYVVPGGTRLGPGRLLAFGKDITRLTLNDNGDSVRLLLPGGAEADSYTYQHSKLGVSYARLPDGGPWSSIGSPSPGQPNRALPGPGGPDTVAIGDFRSWPDGAWVSVRAWVSVPPGLFGARTIQIQDATGGVTVYLGRNDWPPLAVGQPILLELGYLRHRGGQLQLYVRNGWHVHAGAGDVPVSLQPQSISTGQMGAANSGSLVTLSGRVTQLERAAFWLDDGSGPARVLFAASTGLARPPLVRVGDDWQVTGVVMESATAGLLQPAYRLQPRIAADLAQLVGGQLLPYVPAASTPAPTDTPEP